MESDEGAIFVSHGDFALVFRHDERRFGFGNERWWDGSIAQAA